RPPAGSVLSILWPEVDEAPRVQLKTPQGESNTIDYARPASAPAGEVTTTPTGRYRVFGEIGRGGMGSVLRGRDPDLGRDLAIKVLREAHADDPEWRKRFVEEAQIGGQLQHPGVVPVY